MDTQQRHLYIKNTQKSTRKMGIKTKVIKTDEKKDPTPDLEPPKMASENAAAHDRSQEREHAAHAVVTNPDGGIPGHVGPVKQLHSGTGYNLVIDSERKVYGTREPYNDEAILQLTAKNQGEVQIQGQQSKFFLAMNQKGKIYAEEDQDSPNTWFKELYEDSWNYYMWMGNNKEWYLGIKKSGKMKPGHKTKKTQKSVKFVPRAATPSYN